MFAQKIDVNKNPAAELKKKHVADAIKVINMLKALLKSL